MATQKKIPLIVTILSVILYCYSYSAHAEKHEFINKLGMKFISIHPGTFVMGSPLHEVGRKSDEKPHRVIIDKEYYLQITEVTQEQWRAVMGNNPSKFQGCDSCPVENVSWLDAQDFIAKLNALDSANHYRLPTEAEWEYACRAGTATRYSWGDEADCRKANYGNSDLSKECADISPGKTSPVGSYQQNPWGLYDMHGNVWEWCADTYNEYGVDPTTNTKEQPNPSKKIVRGGAYFDPAESCRTANRCWDPEDYRIMDIGFRLVRTLKKP